MRVALVTSLALLWAGNLFAMSEGEFQARQAQLKTSQTQTDALLQRLGASFSGLPSSAPSSKKENSSETPLFRVHGELSQARLPVGKLLYGKLLNRLVVGTDGSPVIVELEPSQGVASSLRLVGVARQSATGSRVAVELNQLLLRSGKAVTLRAMALDDSGASGLEAQVFSSKAIAIGGAMASSFISGYAASQQSQVPNAFGFSTPQNTGRNSLLQGVAQTAADQSKRLIDETTSEKPVMVVEAMTSLVVLVQDEVRF